jgi:hypothetical protein
MNRLAQEHKARILSMLCEGTNIASKRRMNGTAKNTIIKTIRKTTEMQAGVCNYV